jgi:hypothetical protein
LYHFSCFTFAGENTCFCQKRNYINTFIDLRSRIFNLYNTFHATVVADAGYGSEENYAYLAQHNITAFVKYGMFDTEQNSTLQNKHPFTADKLHYNAAQDYYVCPMGQHMHNIGTHTQKTTTGFTQHITKYQAQNCNGCPLRGKCHQSTGNRIININHHLNQHKQQAKHHLQSEQGIVYRKKRCCDTEPVWGNIKNNHHFKRFMLRGLKKVNVEVGLLALAQNLRKKAALKTKNAA